MPMSERSKHALREFGIQAAGFFLLMLGTITLPWSLFVGAIVMLLWPFVMLAHWHWLSPEERLRLTTPPKPEEAEPPGLVARILATCSCAAIAIVGLAISAYTVLSPRPDYVAAVVMTLCAVPILGVIYWVWRPAAHRQTQARVDVAGQSARLDGRSSGARTTAAQATPVARDDAAARDNTQGILSLLLSAFFAAWAIVFAALTILLVLATIGALLGTGSGYAAPIAVGCLAAACGWLTCQIASAVWA
jgi:hypothetical protein